MVRVEKSYASIPQEGQGSRRTKHSRVIYTSLIAVCALSAVAFVAYSSFSSNTPFESLEDESPKPIQYGDYITLKNAYNEYILVDHQGVAYTGGYHQKYDRIQILSGVGNQGPVNFGDSVALVGQNDAFCEVEPSGEFKCQSQHLHKKGLFTIEGGTGPVKALDLVHFEGIFGYLTGRNTGVTGKAEELTSMERFKIELPNEETGLTLNEPLRYGMSIFLRNSNNAYLQVGPNGWIKIAASNGDYDKFEVLSPQHRKGPVRFGDKVILRAHNDNMIQVRENKLTGYTKGRNAHTIFRLVGGEGIIRNNDILALASPFGYVNTHTVGRQADVDPSGHYNAGQNWQLMFAYRH